MPSEPMEVDTLPQKPQVSSVLTGEALAVHMDTFNAEEEDVASYGYRDFLADEGIDPENQEYTPMDNIAAFETLYSALTDWGHNPIGSAHAMSRGGKRYGAFITFLPQNPNAFRMSDHFTTYVPLVFLRNSYDKTYPFTIHVGAHLNAADVLWVSRAEVGQRRHTRHFEDTLYGAVTDMMERMDDLLVEQEHRFGAYGEQYVPDMPRVHDLIFRAHLNGIIPKTKMTDAREAFVDEQGTTGPWPLFTVMQYVLRARRGKDIFAYRRFCGDYEQMLDREVGFNREVRLRE